MATRTMLIAVAVAAVVVVAAAAFVVLSNDRNTGSQVDAIGTDVEVGDYYTLSSSATSTGPSTLASQANTASEDTKYTVTGVDDATGTVDVEVSTGGTTTNETMQKDDFLDDVSVVDPSIIGSYQRDDTVSFGGNTIQCWVYSDQQSVGGNTQVTTYDWVGKDTNIIYKTEILIESANSKQTYRTTLVNTNMIGSASSDDVNVPGSADLSDDIRTDLQEGDYIEFSKYDDDDRDIERFTIVRIDGDDIVYRESGDDDREGATKADFLDLVKYSGDGPSLKTETIRTAYGDIECNVYEMERNRILGDDWEDRLVVWASVDNNVIYKIESHDDYYDDDDRWDDDWDDWYDDIESYYLTGTSLMGPASGGSSGGDAPAPSSNNRYGITLTEKDTYTIQDDDWDDAETYTILSIEGSYLIVEEREEHGDRDVERMSANEFLSEILVTSQQLQNGWEATGQTAENNGIDYQVYRERYDDRELIWVHAYGDNYLVWQQQDDDRDDREVLLNVSIQAHPDIRV